jgi:hypothetical protein
MFSPYPLGNAIFANQRNIFQVQKVELFIFCLMTQSLFKGTLFHVLSQTIFKEKLGECDPKQELIITSPYLYSTPTHVPMPESTLSLRQGLRIWPQTSNTGTEMEFMKVTFC